MSRGIFVQQAGTGHEHSPAEAYRFPARCLGAASAMQGDWAIYFEPSSLRDARGCYAICRVYEVVPDDVPHMYLAVMDTSSYLEFARGVPLANSASVPPASHVEAEGQSTGASPLVRILPNEIFEAIIQRGLTLNDDPLRPDGQMDRGKVREERPPFLFDLPLDPLARYTSQSHRDRLFRMNVLNAYDNRCAFTSNLLMDAGDAHWHATHIRSDDTGGPDGVINGLALTPLMGRLFEVGDISLSDDGRVLVSRHAVDHDRFCQLINSSGHANLPQRHRDRPHPRFLAWHREHRFKGHPLL